MWGVISHNGTNDDAEFRSGANWSGTAAGAALYEWRVTRTERANQTNSPEPYADTV
ncbi:hypothetical protein SBA3_1390018 [Candidatus Sulfopaludibacter sp. SbA3]|nr:hypothetical protein SBA3_1390018 [Candidatus Sulfopaludibacter sp. SbA3]